MGKVKNKNAFTKKGVYSNIISFLQENATEIICIAFLAVVFFNHCYKILFGSDDDLYGYLAVQSNQFLEATAGNAKGQGRIYFYITTLFSWMPFLTNSYFVYKMISFGTILFDIGMLMLVVNKCFNTKMGLLTACFFLGAAQLDCKYNLFICFVGGGHQACIGVLLLGIYFFLKYYDEEKIRYLIISELLMFWSQMFFEGFLLFNIVIAFVSFFKNVKNKRIIIKSILDLRFHILGSLMYVSVYGIFRIIHPSTNVGNVPNFNGWGAFFETVWRFAIGEFPLRQFFFQFSLEDWREYMDILYILKALIIGSVCCRILCKCKYIKARKLWTGMFFAGFCVFLTPIMHGFTYKYAVLCRDWKSYLPSFYSYFFICIVLAGIFILCYQNIRWKKIVICVTFLLIFNVSVLTDLNNNYYSSEAEKVTKRRLAYAETINNEDFASVPNGSLIYQPEWMGVYGELAYVENWVNIQLGKEWNLTYNPEEIVSSEGVYYLRYSEEAEAVWYGAMDVEMKTDKIRLKPMNGTDISIVIVSDNMNNIYKINGREVNYGSTAIIPGEFINGDYMDIEGDISIEKVYVIRGNQINNIQ